MASSSCRRCQGYLSRFLRPRLLLLPLAVPALVALPAGAAGDAGRALPSCGQCWHVPRLLLGVWRCGAGLLPLHKGGLCTVVVSWLCCLTLDLFGPCTPKKPSVTARLLIGKMALVLDGHALPLAAFSLCIVAVTAPRPP